MGSVNAYLVTEFHHEGVVCAEKGLAKWSSARAFAPGAPGPTPLGTGDIDTPSPVSGW
jgi:hypothetical protein